MKKQSGGKFMRAVMGRMLATDFAIEEAEAAQATSEAEFRAWASQHLNLEIGLALRSDRWVGADCWETAPRHAFSLEDLIAQCDVATVGIDGGGLDDLLALAFVGREAVGTGPASDSGGGRP
jgi:phage terminase large subunit-like protein